MSINAMNGGHVGHVSRDVVGGRGGGPNDGGKRDKSRGRDAKDGGRYGKDGGRGDGQVGIKRDASDGGGGRKRIKDDHSDITQAAESYKSYGE